MKDWLVLGCERHLVTLVPYQPAWVELFQQEAAQLRAALGDQVMRIEHVGSTSLPGVDAKPILDIVVAVRDMTEVAAFEQALRSLGYIHQAGNDMPGRLYFVKRLPDDRSTHHLNITELGTECWFTHVAFRDHLREHPEARDEYRTLKLDLAHRHPTDRAAYREKKGAFIERILSLAREMCDNGVTGASRRQDAGRRIAVSVPTTILDWLLEPDEPSVRYGTLVDLMGEPRDSPRARRARGAIRRSARAQALLAGQQPDGSFGCHPYTKWRGSHWRLIRLADLDYPPKGRALKRAIDDALPWLLSHQPPIIRGRARRCGSQQGAAVLYCTRLGYGDDPRVQMLADRLLEWQWPDGGWNCDKRPVADHSSFHETWLPLWGLAEYCRLTGNTQVKAGVDRAAELLLSHRLFRRDHAAGQPVIRQRFVQLLYPAYWHYQILDACRALDAAGKLTDARATEALEIIASLRRPDGRWAPQLARWSRPTSRPKSGVEVVPWARKGQPCKFLTLNAMRVLRKAT